MSNSFRNHKKKILKRILEDTYRAGTCGSLTRNGVMSSRHPLADVMVGSLSQMKEGRCLPLVKNTIQFRQSLESKNV